MRAIYSVLVFASLTLAYLVSGNTGDESPASDSGYPLHDAVEAGDTEMIEIVLKQLQDMSSDTVEQALDEVDGNKLTALQMAAYKGHPDAAAMLLTAGAPTETKVEGMGMTALHWAAAQGNAAVLAVLIDGGADLDARDESERTALHYTAARGHTEAAATLIAAIVASAVGNSLAGLEALSGRGTTSLQLASEHGHIVVINQLVEAGANIDAAADEGKMQPLHVAAAMGHVEAVSALISAGAVVDARDRRLRTPLALAASYGRTSAVVALLAAGADRSAEDAEGTSAEDAAGSHADAVAAFGSAGKGARGGKKKANRRNEEL